MAVKSPTPIRLVDYAPPAYLIDTVSLDVSLHPTRTRVHAKLRLRPNPAAGRGHRPLQLDGEILELEDIRLDRRKLTAGKDYDVSDTALTIVKPPRGPFTVETVVYCNPEANKALQGLYLSRGIYCTQCEAEGFRRITYCLDRPDVLSVYTVRVEADRADVPVLLANGNLRERGRVERGDRHYALWHDPHPKPSYLFALVGGNLAAFSSDFTTMSGRKVDLAIYVEPGKVDRCAWAMDALKRSMRWDEERFGREYDLDVFNIVAVSDFNMGAMENKGLNIFNDRLILASPDTATDVTFEAIETVVAHEYFHNWTGNRITCRDWFQLCLKEGLTVFRDQEFSADQRSAAVQRIADVRDLKARQFAEDAGPLAHPVRPEKYIEINNFYTATVYDKGAELVRMIQTIVGRDGFARGMDLYFERHDGEAATVEQFVACFADATGADLDQFMVWYRQAGTPELVCKLDYDANAKTADLTIEQVLPPTPGEPRKKPLHIPIRLGLLGGNGHDLPLKLADGRELEDGVVHLRDRRQTFRFTEVPSRPVPSVLRGFSAPVNLNVELSDRDLEFLMASDSDLYNRWQAAQDYAMRIIIAGVKAIRSGGRPVIPRAFIGAIGSTLDDETLEPAYRAHVLAIPSEADIARVIAQNVDPQAIHRSRRALRRAIGVALAPHLSAVYDQLVTKGPYSPEAASAGRRSLRNAALSLLADRRRPEDIARVAAHFASAANATDEIDALGILSRMRCPERETALERFHQRWKGDHLVIDHWFAFQAASPLPNTLQVVERLLDHPLFSLQNPNKARALIGTFAASNPLIFNRPDGRGYEFLAHQVLAIDGFNPQLASRLVGSLRNWRSLEAGRRRFAKRALNGVLKAKSLSKDVHEMVFRMLE